MGKTRFLRLSYGIYSIFEFLCWCKQNDCVLTGTKVLWEPWACPGKVPTLQSLVLNRWMDGWMDAICPSTCHPCNFCKNEGTDVNAARGGWRSVLICCVKAQLPLPPLSSPVHNPAAVIQTHTHHCGGATDTHSHIFYNPGISNRQPGAVAPCEEMTDQQDRRTNPHGQIGEFNSCLIQSIAVD